MALPRVLIVGGGFGGLAAARGLARASVEVVLVDQRNHHLFQPLLYQVASAAVSSVEIAAPLRHVLHRQANATVALGEVISIAPAKREATIGATLRDDGADRTTVTIAYDWLILAPGAVDHYFGHDAWAALAPSLKSLDDALEIRSRILFAFERAETEHDAAARQAWITFVIVGAGPTGVELAGAIKQLAVDAIVRDYRHVDTAATRVVLIEAGDRTLPAMRPASSKSAQRQLEGLGVEVRTGCRVDDVTEHGVRLDGGETIAARTVLWAAGVRAAPLLATLGAPLDRGGRVAVMPDLSIAGHPEVFVIGDAAAVTDATGRAVPGIAPAAMQMGRYVATLIRDESRRGKPERDRELAAARAPFRYRDKGTMATIGRSRAVAEVGGHCFGGVFAWLLWLFVHLVFLIGFRNRIVVLISWAQSYVFFRAGARVITQSRREV